MPDTTAVIVMIILAMFFVGGLVTYPGNIAGLQTMFSSSAEKAQRAQEAKEWEELEYRRRHAQHMLERKKAHRALLNDFDHEYARLLINPPEGKE